MTVSYLHENQDQLVVSLSSSTNSQVSKGAVGFSLRGALLSEAESHLQEAHKCALRHFPWLKRYQVHHANIVLDLWSHSEAKNSLYQAIDGTTFALIGSPMNDISWVDALEQLSLQGDNRFELPWEGRCILIRISPDGDDWTLWNDWCGSVPIFHASVAGVPVASSLEAVVVAAAGFASSDFSKRGIVELLVHGHFLGTDTLYRGMFTLPADSVSRWEKGRFCSSKLLWTVEPFDAHSDSNWDDLMLEMHELTVNSIKSALRQHDTWLLPLSGGMDSRLVACVANEIGVDVNAFTYGPRRWYEVRYARQLAKTLDIKWEWVDPGANYLVDYTPIWLDWFGSSLHVHGMYQMPFLESLRALDGCIMEGFYGNNLAGGNHPSAGLLNNAGSVWHRFYSGYRGHWLLEDLRNLLNFDVVSCVDDMMTILSDQENLVSEWPYYQRMNAIDMWNRQQRFIFYQPIMYDFYKGVSEPFMTREFARFCFSLPRRALEGRRLQREVLKRFWPEAAAVEGTFDPPSQVERGKRKVMRHVASGLPYGPLYRRLQRSLPWPNTMQGDNVKAHQWHSLYPISPSLIDLLPQDSCLNHKVILETCHNALAGDQAAHKKLLPVQTIIHRMVEDKPKQ